MTRSSTRAAAARGGVTKASAANAAYAKGLARAFGGALIFALPLLMTMEMWSLGVFIDAARLALFLILGLPLLVGLSYYAGFRDTQSWEEDVLDALAAYGVGFVASAVLLVLFGVIGPDATAREAVAKVAVQALPAAIGALVARTQLSGGDDDDEDMPSEARRSDYFSELFLMAVGALVIAFNVAPTEEMVLIAYRMTAWHALAMVAASLAVLHGFVYSVGFAGQEEGHGSGSGWRTFIHFTLAGYVLALLVSLYILWTFGRADGQSFASLFRTVLVLGLPASLGAAAARLLV